MKKIIIAVLVISNIMFSCQKEMDENSLLNPPVTNLLDSSYLDKIYAVDSIAGIKDTIGYMQFNYDNLRRVSSIASYNIDASGTTLNFLYQYYYNSNDSMPFKQLLLQYGNSGSNTDSTLTYYTYDAQKRNLKDSNITIYYSSVSTDVFVSQSVTTYQYNGQLIYGQSFSRMISPQPSAVPNETRDTAITDQNGNVISSKKWRINFGGNTWQLVNAVSTYDTKKNPFKKLSNFRTWHVFSTGETFFWEIQSANNRLTNNETILEAPGGNVYTYSEDLTGGYEYNALGYPLKAKTPVPFNGIYEIAIFTYKNL